MIEIVGCSYQQIKEIAINIWLFVTIGAVNKKLKAKEIYTDNEVQSTLRLFDNWPNSPFTTSKTKRYY